jgi:hypothetical protein
MRPSYLPDNMHVTRTGRDIFIVICEWRFDNCQYRRVLGNVNNYSVWTVNDSYLYKGQKSDHISLEEPE